MMFRWACFAILALVSNVAAAQQIISSSGSAALGWASGTLSQKLGKGDLTVRFSGSPYPFPTLVSLGISTSDWNVNVDRYVEGLAAPYPTRILVHGPGQDNGGNLNVVSVVIPYRSVSISEGQCMELELVIRNGRVSENRTYQTPDFRCQP